MLLIIVARNFSHLINIIVSNVGNDKMINTTTIVQERDKEDAFG
jgi:hypothetical protein